MRHPEQCAISSSTGPDDDLNPPTPGTPISRDIYDDSDRSTLSTDEETIVAVFR